MRTVLSYFRTIFGMYVPTYRYKQIFKEIESLKPVSIMEIGTWNGERAVQMIRVAMKFRPVSEISYVGFDLFETITKDVYKHEISKIPPFQKVVLNNLSATGANIKLFVGYTEETMKNIDLLLNIDFVFIDGGHAAETVLNDWKGVQKVMNKNTTVIFDDYWHNRHDGPKIVIDDIDRQKYDVEILPEIDVFFNPDFGKLVISLVKVKLKT